MLLSSMRHTSATTQYVSSYLQRQGIDSFTLEYLQITRPFVFRLSVARDIEPVLSWLRSVGCGGDKLVDLVRHAPGILSASVDDHLEPLAALVQEAGGRPQNVLGMCCPGIFEVPVGQLAAARLVLRHMGASEGAVSQLLLRAPDVYVQLTQALMHLFPDWMQQHQLSPWNSSKWMAAPGSSSSYSSGTAHGAAACPPDFLLQAKRLHGCQVRRCLLQVLAALDAFKPQGAVEWDAAAAETAAADVQHAIDGLDRALLDEQHAPPYVVCA